MAAQYDSEIAIIVTQLQCTTYWPTCEDHPHIVPYLAAIHPALGGNAIGQMMLYKLEKGAMERIGPHEMCDQCLGYDRMHFGGKLDKVDNFISNENFYMHTRMGFAEVIVYIDGVVLEKSWRGRDLSLQAVRMAIKQLVLPQATVLLLQPGAVGHSLGNPEEAGERLERHWHKLGFRCWSYTDGSWMCVGKEDMTPEPGPEHHRVLSWRRQVLAGTP